LTNRTERRWLGEGKGANAKERWGQVKMGEKQCLRMLPGQEKKYWRERKRERGLG